MEILTRQTRNKNDEVAGIIDRVLSQVFGKEATTLIYGHMERKYCLKRSEIGDKIDLFAQGLEDFLKSGAYVIERKILEDLDSDSSLLRKMQLKNVDDETGFVSQMKLFMHTA
jgi:hypothetical protein